MRGHPYVKSAIDMACWDLLGKASGLPVATLMGGHVGRGLRALPRDLAGIAGADGGEGRRVSQRGLHASSSSRWAAIPTSTSSASARPRRSSSRGDVLIADANTGWTQHAAVRVADAVRDVDVYIEQPCTHLRAVPRRAPAHRPAVRARRGHRRHRHGGARRGRSGDGRHQPEDLQGGRPDQGAADSRPLRFARHRHDDRGHLGWRHHHRGHRAPGAQHAGALPLLGDRLQQLCDGGVRRWRAAARARPAGRVAGAGAGRDAR